MWNLHEIRNHLENLQTEFHFKIPQMQVLLCQERFLLRLYQLEEGKNYIWKGGKFVSEKVSGSSSKTPLDSGFGSGGMENQHVKKQKLF